MPHLEVIPPSLSVTQFRRNYEIINVCVLADLISYFDEIKTLTKNKYYTPKANI